MVGAPHDVSMMGLMTPMMEALVLSAFGSQKAVMFIGKPSPPDLIFLGELITTGKLKPVIDKCYPLSEVVDALRRVEEGHARGKVLITCEYSAEY